MDNKFYVEKGRYESLGVSRYKVHTYGRYSFAKPVDEDNAHFKSHGSYGGLLFDKRWQKKRKEILVRDAYRCVNCGSRGSLQVHHRQYHYIKALRQFKSPWDYDDSLMITLCERCHSKGHSKYRIPSIYI